MCLAAASYALAASSAVSNVPSHNLAPRFGSRISAAQLPHGRCLTPRYCDVVAFFDCLSPLPPCVRRRASSVTSTPAFDALSLSRALDLAITTVPIARPRLVVLCRSLASRSPRVLVPRVVPRRPAFPQFPPVSSLSSSSLPRSRSHLEIIEIIVQRVVLVGIRRRFPRVRAVMRRHRARRVALRALPTFALFRAFASTRARSPSRPRASRAPRGRPSRSSRCARVASRRVARARGGVAPSTRGVGAKRADEKASRESAERPIDRWRLGNVSLSAPSTDGDS